MFISRMAKPWQSFLQLQQRMMRLIHIETKQTPNPNFLKFIPEGKRVMGDMGTLDIMSKQYAEVSPLAQQLFQIQGVTRVFYGSDYMSIAKQETLEWGTLKPEIYHVISQFYEGKLPLLTGEAALDEGDINPDDSETILFIKQILASRIRPTVQEDGGDVRFVEFNQETGKLTLRLVGACSGCPSASVTLKNGIERMLTYYISQVKEVVAED